jgi:hypothetical protein
MNVIPLVSSLTASDKDQCGNSDTYTVERIDPLHCGHLYCNVTQRSRIITAAESDHPMSHSREVGVPAQPNRGRIHPASSDQHHAMFASGITQC